MEKQKVFGIGFYKTGTSSLAAALNHLGYNVTGPNGVADADIAQKFEEMAFRLAGRYDAFQDWPWPLVYQQMDKRYPGSKFILTERPVEKWLQSALKHSGNNISPMHQLVFQSRR